MKAAATSTSGTRSSGRRPVDGRGRVGGLARPRACRQGCRRACSAAWSAAACSVLAPAVLRRPPLLSGLSRWGPPGLMAGATVTTAVDVPPDGVRPRPQHPRHHRHHAPPSPGGSAGLRRRARPGRRPHTVGVLHGDTAADMPAPLARTVTESAAWAVTGAAVHLRLLIGGSALLVIAIAPRSSCGTATHRRRRNRPAERQASAALRGTPEARRARTPGPRRPFGRADGGGPAMRHLAPRRVCRGSGQAPGSTPVRATWEDQRALALGMRVPVG